MSDENKIVIPEDFVWNHYVELNNDINFMCKNDACNHYITNGYSEKRKYKYEHIPKDFDWVAYNVLNFDLNINSCSDARVHYEIFGHKENRKYKYDYVEVDNEQYNIFDHVKYNKFYCLNITEKKQLYLHWLNYGRYNHHYFFTVDTQNKKKDKCYIITRKNLTGGTMKYIYDLIDDYNNIYEFVYLDKNMLIDVTSKDIIIIQYLNEKIHTIDNIILTKKKTKCKLFVSIHDFYWLNNDVFELYLDYHGKYLCNDICISNDVIKLFSVCDYIIHPSFFTFNEYSKYFDKTNFIKLEHNDIIAQNNINYVPKIMDNTINIGCMHIMTKCKGKHIIEYLMKNVSQYKNYKINWLFPKYKENDFFDCLEKYNIHGLVHLNTLGESWCYLLSKSLCSGLPIIYNNIGSYKERIKSSDHYFIMYENETKINNNDNNTIKIFQNYLDYIIKQNNAIKKQNINVTKQKPYDFLFLH